MTSLMLDIETLGLRPGSAILEIAAAAFDPDDGEILHEFHVEVDIISSIARGMTVDAATAAWHLRNGYQGSLRGRDLVSALSRLTIFIETYQNTEIYAWGMDFERPMLEAAYATTGGLTLPWPYTRGNCARTLWKSAFGTKPATRKVHRALADVRIQIQDLVRALKSLSPEPNTETNN